MGLVYFIADVHLERDDPIKRDLFFSFIEMVKDRRGDLYILGDLFDYWANNRRVMADNQSVLESLAELTRHGSRVSFLIGNRDLLLGQKVLSAYGIDFLGERAEVTIQGKHILLTHGHLLCTNDLTFQRYRKTKWPLYRVLDAILPGSIENALAKRFMLKSKQVIGAQESWRFQFPDEVINEILREGIDMIICGHAHKPAVRHYEHKQPLVVLSSWTSDRGGYLVMRNGEFQAGEFSLNEKVNRKN